MGIPKFFRWVSERYPLCTELVTENRIPEFENLYLDMNGIIHTCSHPSDDVSYRITETEIFLSIFRYIEYIFTKIRPTKLFFLAVDGVAPRAKMNQQRARRFRTAQEVIEKTEEAKRKGLPLPEEPPFDSNCITPGTRFMDKLHHQLQYFLAKKLTEDAAWRGVEIVLSGHDVPGEGEHKIMEYIRLAKSQPDYNPNLRHCLYGLDADLMMLGLLSHEPHFSLLREEVKFGLGRKNAAKTSQNFFLLHLSLFREYLDIEFSALKSSLPFEYSLERVIDDYILMAFFVGNDFLPHLPGIHINEGAFELIFECYKQLMPQLGGYLHQNGELHLQRCERLLQEIGKREVEIFSQTWVDEDEVVIKKSKKKGKKRQGNDAVKSNSPSVGPLWYRELKAYIFNKQTDVPLRLTISPNDTLQVSELAKKLGLLFDVELDDEEEFPDQRVVIIERAEDDDEDDFDEESFDAQKRVLKSYDATFDGAVADENGINDAEKTTEVSSSPDQKFQQAMLEWKRDYYKSKLEINYDDEPSRRKVVYHYVQGLQWVLYYYYRGVQSWEWFYPYHYAPKITDVINLVEFSFDFDRGKPFKPFEQLMGVLPPASKEHIPEAFRILMLDLDSPIIDFYPEKFEMDSHESKTPWEAIVKIPFIEESRLLKALEARYAQLTDDEKRRNQFGPSLSFTYSETSSFYKSSLPNIFPDLTKCHAAVRVYDLPVLGIDGLKHGLNENALLGDKLLAGFPSLRTLPHTGTLAYHGIVVYGYASKNPTIVVSIDDNDLLKVDIETRAKALINNQVFVGWPYLLEAKVHHLEDELFSYNLVKTKAGEAVNKVPHDQRELSSFGKNAEELENHYSRRYGVLTGKVECIVYVQTLVGMDVLHDGSMVKVFSDKLTPYALQTIVFGSQFEDPRCAYKPAPPLEAEFPVGLVLFSVAPALYGATCKVMGYTENKRLKLKIRMSADPTLRAQPKFTKELAQKEEQGDWYQIRYMAKLTQMPISVLSRVTSSLYVAIKGKDKKFNLGLNLKFDTKGLKVLGYTRKTESGWEFSRRAVELVQAYKAAFPEFFTVLAKRTSQPLYYHTDIYPDTEEYAEKATRVMKMMEDWLKEKGVKNFVACPVESKALSQEIISQIESRVTEYSTSLNQAGPDHKDFACTRGMVLIPSQVKYRLCHQLFDLGDRVVSASDEGSVPIGCFGTVVAVDKSYIDVVFDEPLLGGTDLGGKCSPGRGFTLHKDTCLNLTTIQPPPSMKSQVSSIRPPEPVHPFAEQKRIVSNKDGKMVLEKRSSQTGRNDEGRGQEPRYRREPPPPAPPSAWIQGPSEAVKVKQPRQQQNQQRHQSQQRYPQQSMNGYGNVGPGMSVPPQPNLDQMTNDIKFMLYKNANTGPVPVQQQGQPSNIAEIEAGIKNVLNINGNQGGHSFASTGQARGPPVQVQVDPAVPVLVETEAQRQDATRQIWNMLKANTAPAPSSSQPVHSQPEQYYHSGRGNRGGHRGRGAYNNYESRHDDHRHNDYSDDYEDGDRHYRSNRGRGGHHGGGRGHRGGYRGRGQHRGGRNSHSEQE